jgi:hypothetical protein
MLDSNFDTVTGVWIAQSLAYLDDLISQSACSIVERVHATRVMSAGTLIDRYKVALGKALPMRSGKRLTLAALNTRQSGGRHGF